MRNYKWDTAPDIYIGNDSVSRFALGRTGTNPLICFGVNPSTANERFADKTLHMVEQISKLNGFDGWIMLNIYPLRATDPDSLPNEVDSLLHKENLKTIQTILRGEDTVLWAAWGETILKRKYLIGCLQDICKLTRTLKDCNWVSFGSEKDGRVISTTKGNHPRHPSRLSLSAKQSPYDVEHYFSC